MSGVHQSIYLSVLSLAVRILGKEHSHGICFSIEQDSEAFWLGCIVYLSGLLLYINKWITE
jgi:hypothetical protein